MTLTEKILARASGKARVQAGDNVWVNADVLMTHDVCGPGTIGVFKREFGKSAKVWDRNRVVIIPDHYIFTADSKSNRNVDILRDFSRETVRRRRDEGYRIARTCLSPIFAGLGPASQQQPRTHH